MGLLASNGALQNARPHLPPPHFHAENVIPPPACDKRAKARPRQPRHTRGMFRPPLFPRLIRLLPLACVAALIHAHAAGGLNPRCPIMTGDDADGEITVKHRGIEIAFCCGPCVRQFKKEPDYYLRLFQEMQSVHQAQALALPENVRLLEQRFCPFSTARLVGPASPSVEYRGVKIYLSKPGHVATWNAEPDKHARAAFEKGLLPQLKGRL